ncbi:hypothetical protein ACSSWA_06825 [Melioribacter sp. Ez-97]|uniref:hypothetical protein n=1 Tax=Melioribacter sp. Ez-97 TaxID=3423434 RepID=UPI003ED9464E
MKRFVLMMILMPMISIYGQRIGKLAPEKPNEVFPENSWGIDIMFGEGGFGLGTFFRKSLSENITGFADLSVSESKDEREIEYIDPYFGIPYVIGKKNRVFLIPLNFGVHYRLFSNTLTDNLRPYVNAGVGPTFVLTTPYEKEFFSSFGDAKMHYAAGGYVGIGANFGISKKNLAGLNVRYYFIHMLDDGVESLEGKVRKDFGHIYITLNLGIMY